jgi:uncharacterized protein
MHSDVIDKLRSHPAIQAFMEQADQYLEVLGYTEHSYRHANLSASIAANVLERLGFDERQQDLAATAGFLHDIGNSLAREFHGESSALIVKDFLVELGYSYPEIACVMNAISNHEEEFGVPTSAVAAAIVLADKSDVHQTRVRAIDPATYDIHDRVNLAVTRSFLRVDAEQKTITLELEIDNEIVSTMDYFEIFLSRMLMCRRAAEFLGCHFRMMINGTTLL